MVRLAAEYDERVLGTAACSGRAACVLATRTDEGQSSTGAALLWDLEAGARTEQIAAHGRAGGPRPQLGLRGAPACVTRRAMCC